MLNIKYNKERKGETTYVIN